MTQFTIHHILNLTGFTIVNMAIQTPYKAPFSRRNARVTARQNIQYAADDVSGVFELVSADLETLSTL